MDSKEKLLNEHIEELKRDLKDEGFKENSMLVKQMIRLTRESIRQHYDIEELKEKITALEGRVPVRQTVEIPNPVINLTVSDAEKLQEEIQKKITESRLKHYRTEQSSPRVIEGLDVKIGKSSKEAK